MEIWRSRTFPALLALFVPLVSVAQVAVPSNYAGEIESKFASRDDGPSFDCRFRFYHPALNFSLGFEVAYVVTISYERAHPPLTLPDILVRVTKKNVGTSSEYFKSQHDPKDVSAGRVNYKMAGRFAVSDGSQNVEAIAIDDLGRVCRGDWQVDVPPRSGRVRPVPNQTVPKISVFLDAAPLNWRNSGLQPTDVPLLTEALSTLIRQLPAKRVRLVVFNLDLEGEIFRSDFFQAREIEQVQNAIASMQLRTIDYRKLGSLRGPAAYLGSVLQREINDPEPSSAIVFLGPLARSGQIVPKKFVKTGAAVPQFFYVQYRENLRAPPDPNGAVDNNASMGAGSGFPAPPSPAANLRDTIMTAVERLGGRTSIVSSPKEFLRALDRVRNQLIHEK